MFNALVMSYTRLPMAMAEDGMLPRVAGPSQPPRRSLGQRAVLRGAWALALKLPFERLISIDLILYGASLLLEFVALAVLRIREPELERPFKAGNFAFACLLGVGPAVLIGYALYVSHDEKLDRLCLRVRRSLRRGAARTSALRGHCGRANAPPRSGGVGRAMNRGATLRARRFTRRVDFAD